jgi:polar amino acid transport system permease protein
VVAEDLISVAPPGARPAARFRGNLPVAIAGAAASIAVTAFVWAMLWNFDQSLHVNTAQHTTARLIELVLALLTLLVPVFGIRALTASLEAQRLAASDQRYEAQIALEDSRDRLWVVVGLGLSAFVIGFMALLLSANSGRVRAVLFNWSLIWDHRTGLLHGFVLNIKLFLVAEPLVLIWALLVAVVRQLPGRACMPIRTLAIVYTDVFRGIPAIITIYLIVFGFSLAEIPPFNHLNGNDQIFWLGILALVLVYGAYVAEVYRAGLESVHWSQSAAARSLGLNEVQSMRHVVIPQAVRRILPPLLNDFVALQKDTSLFVIVGALEVLNEAQIFKGQDFNLSAVTGAAICFLVITIPLTRFVDWLIKRDRERTLAQ